MAQTYMTALFDDEGHARNAKRALESLPGVQVRRAFLVRRDKDGMHVDGPYPGELPTIDNVLSFTMLRTAIARVIRGSSREEDGVAIEDAEQALSVGQPAVVALLDETDTAPVDQAMHERGGTVTRAAISTVDAEDTQRFLAATNLDER